MTMATDPPVRSLSERETLIRTRLAFERTLMAWIRTAVSLITFGFTIFKAFAYAQEKGLGAHQGRLSPRMFALLMISVGIASIALATVQHYRHVKAMRTLYHDLPVASIGLATAGLVSLLGVLALLSALFRQ
jgi:putative membrane protein